MSDRFYLYCCTFEAGMEEPEWNLVRKFTFISDMFSIFNKKGRLPVGYRIVDTKTGEVWNAGDTLI